MRLTPTSAHGQRLGRTQGPGFVGLLTVLREPGGLVAGLPAARSSPRPPAPADLLDGSDKRHLGGLEATSSGQREPGFNGEPRSGSGGMSL